MFDAYVWRLAYYTRSYQNNLAVKPTKAPYSILKAKLQTYSAHSAICSTLIAVTVWYFITVCVYHFYLLLPLIAIKQFINYNYCDFMWLPLLYRDCHSLTAVTSVSLRLLQFYCDYRSFRAVTSYSFSYTAVSPRLYSDCAAVLPRLYRGFTAVISQFYCCYVAVLPRLYCGSGYCFTL